MCQAKILPQFQNLPLEVQAKLNGTADLSTQEGMSQFHQEFWSPELMKQFAAIDKHLAESKIASTQTFFN